MVSEELLLAARENSPLSVCDFSRIILTFTTSGQSVITDFILIVGVRQEIHKCQLNVKPVTRLGINSQSHSKSHLKMTRNNYQFIVDFSKLWLLAMKFISWQVC